MRKKNTKQAGAPSVAVQQVVSCLTQQWTQRRTWLLNESKLYAKAELYAAAAEHKAKADECLRCIACLENKAANTKLTDGDDL